LDIHLEGFVGKYTESVKLAAIKEYCSGEAGLKTVAQKHNVNVSSLRKWISGDRAHGEAGVAEKKRQSYGVELKLTVLKRMREERLSHRQAAALFNIRRFDMSGRWERQYHQGGPEALSCGSRGRHRKMTKPPPLKNKTQAPDDARSRPQLLDELCDLRMENAYLKKLNALVQASEQSARESERRSCLS
jgi:transposase